jgi:hypothetical protein
LTTPEEMVPAIYGRLVDILVRAAAESVLAHLRKLEEEGLAREEEGLWSLEKTDRKDTGEEEKGRNDF